MEQLRGRGERPQCQTRRGHLIWGIAAEEEFVDERYSYVW
jgi:hypothetical protein